MLEDILAILQYVKTQSPVSLISGTTPKNDSSYRPPPATDKLPSIASKWPIPNLENFALPGDAYKKTTNLPTTQTVLCIYSVCDSNVQTSLINHLPISLWWLKAKCSKPLNIQQPNRWTQLLITWNLEA